ncbi:MAG: carbohydrate ABC transporter permease [Clostridia bacterium]|nr:carbohydrate ABC transporter permease [Clostridia bacterium]MBQ2433534.1 carbohydrate ABC transporter permease [Clostridia bacterium]
MTQKITPVKKKAKTNYSISDILFYIVVYGILIFALVAVAYPLIYVVSASFSSPAAVSSGRVVLWPVQPTLLAYETVINYKNIWIGYQNSIFYMVVGTVFALVFNTMAAFPLSRKEFIGRRFFTLVLAVTMYVSGGLVPTYLLISSLHLLDTIWVMIIPTATSVWHIIMIRTYFTNSVPEELYEAGQLDGCSDIGFMLRILVPLSGPIIAVIALYTAVSIWNAYFNGMIYLTKQELYPLQLFLRNILTIGDSINLEEAEENIEEMQNLIGLSNLMRYAVIVVASVPVMLIYPFVQRFFVKGVVVGSVKG